MLLFLLECSRQNERLVEIPFLFLPFLFSYSSFFTITCCQLIVNRIICCCFSIYPCFMFFFDIFCYYPDFFFSLSQLQIKMALPLQLFFLSLSSTLNFSVTVQLCSFYWINFDIVRCFVVNYNKQCYRPLWLNCNLQQSSVAFLKFQKER